MLGRGPSRSAFAARGWFTPDFARLPGPERPLAREYLRLARLPFTRGYRLEDGLRAETSRFWATVATEEAQHSMAFFFVRQAAKAHAVGSASYGRPGRLAIAIQEDNVSLGPPGRTHSA